MRNNEILIKRAQSGDEAAFDEVIMNNVRKLWQWNGACAVEQLALDGVKVPEDCKFTVVVPSMIIANPIQIIEATEVACKSIEAVKEWKR